METPYFRETDVGVDKAPEAPQQTHLESVAIGLAKLAGISDDFKSWLKHRLIEHELVFIDTTNLPPNPKHAPPPWIPAIHPRIADRKLIWLLDKIENAPKPQRQEVVKILTHACDNTMPEAAAWGILFVETLNVFPAGHPFRDSQLVYLQPVILGPGWRLLEPQTLTRLVSKISLAALAKCIESANFKLEDLEPEVHSWLVEGSGVKLYSAEQNQDFANVLNRARESGLPLASDHEKVDVLALQPGIDGSYDTLLAGLTELQ